MEKTIRSALTLITPQIATGASYSHDAQELLLRIIEQEGATRETVTGKHLTELGERLTAIAGSGKREGSSWSRSYLSQVIRGKMNPSPKLTAACLALLQEMKGESPLKTRSHPVTVLALGNLEPNTIIWGDTHHCDYPPCAQPFLRRAPRQRYCTPDCRKADKKRRNSNSGKAST